MSDKEDISYGEGLKGDATLHNGMPNLGEIDTPILLLPVELQEGIEQSINVAQFEPSSSTEISVRVIDEVAQLDARNSVSNVTSEVYGNPSKFADAYMLLTPKLLGYLIRKFKFSPQDAEQLAHDIHMQALQKLPLYDASKSEFPRWFFSIAHHMAIDQIRRNNRRPKTHSDNKNPEILLIDIESNEKAVDSEILLSATKSRVREALVILGRSTPKQRQALEMAYFEGKTQSEIAEILGLPLGTIKTRMRLGLLKLQEILGDERDYLMDDI